MKNTRTCPRELFRRDLLQHLQSWRDDGEKLVVLMDSNEDMISGKLARAFRRPELQLQDVINFRTKLEGPPTFIRGQRQIDGAWATKDVTIAAAGFLPFNFGAGAHRGIYVDIPYSSFVGTSLRRIDRPTVRRLVCTQEQVYKKYCDELERYLVQHRVDGKLQVLESKSNLSLEVSHSAMEALDVVIGEGMRMAEKRCRKLKMGAVLFSP